MGSCYFHFMEKTVLITGASSGFGEATAKLLAKDGYRLILVARRMDRLESLKKELGTDICIAKVDVTNKNQVERFFEELPEQFSEIDVLLNNAGLATTVEFSQECSLRDWETMVDTNIKGVLNLVHFVLPQMVERNNGHIVNIGSVAGVAPYPGGNVYGATKAFVKQFSHNLRADLLGTAVRVTDIAPGAAETEFSLVRYKGDEEKAKKVYENARVITAEDIADTVKWVIERPLRMNVDYIEVMPLDQTYAGLRMYRGE